MMPLSMIAYVDSYALVQVPLFIFAGELMNHGGLTARLIDWAQSLVGRVQAAASAMSRSSPISSCRACRAPRSPTPSRPASR